MQIILDIDSLIEARTLIHALRLYRQKHTEFKGALKVEDKSAPELWELIDRAERVTTKIEQSILSQLS